MLQPSHGKKDNMKNGKTRLSAKEREYEEMCKKIDRKKIDLDAYCLKHIKRIAH